mgnify:FL=1
MASSAHAVLRVPGHQLLIHADGAIRDASRFARTVHANGAKLDAGDPFFGSHSLRFQAPGDHLRIERHGDQGAPASYTVDFRVRIPVLPSDTGQPMTVFAQGTDSLNQWCLEIDTSDRWAFRSLSAGLPYSWHSSTPMPDDGAWHHVALTVECDALGMEGSARLFLDGAEIGTGWVLQAGVHQGDTVLGASVDGTNGFTGNLDEIAVIETMKWEEAFSPPAAPYHGALASVRSVALMPNRPARPEADTVLWGAVNAGQPTQSGALNYEWTFEHGPGVSIQQVAGKLSGRVADPAFVSTTVTLTLQGITSAPVQATLTVSDEKKQLSKTATIRVIAAGDIKSSTPEKSIEIDREIAVARAERFLYLNQNRDGSWGDRFGTYGTDHHIAATACAVWALQNCGHTPDRDPQQDLFQPSVQAGLDILLEKATCPAIATTPHGSPDTNGDGVGAVLGGSVERGNAGYTVPMCLAALCASKTPARLTTRGPFDNAGAGTTYLEIVRNAVDAIVWVLGRNHDGGWGYTFDSRHDHWADMSIASWNYIALEAAEAFGAALPGWVRARCEALLQKTANADGSFGYRKPGRTSPARVGAGLAGLNFVTQRARRPGFAAGRRMVAAGAFLAENWKSAGRDHHHGDGYQMWMVARALRLARMDRLNTTSGAVDWQRNSPVADPAHEGIWAYLARTQKNAGSWPVRGRYDYGTVLDSSLKLLCLRRGVIGHTRSLHNVEVIAELPLASETKLVQGRFRGQTPVIEELTESRRLTWTLGDMARGEAENLSYDLRLDDLVPGETRRVQDSVSVTWQNERGDRLHRRCGPLHVQVRPSLYRIHVQPENPPYKSGDVLEATVDVELPPGQAFQRVVLPAGKNYVFEPGLSGAGARWTAFQYEVLTEKPHDQARAPVGFAFRSAASLQALARTAFSEPLLKNNTIVPCPPGRFLEVTLRNLGNPELPPQPLDHFTVFYNSDPSVIDVDIIAANGTVVKKVNRFPLKTSDYGKEWTRPLEAVLDPVSRGSYFLRARILQGDAAVATSRCGIQVAATSPVGLAADLDVSGSVFGAREKVRIISRIQHKTGAGTPSDVRIDVSITGPSGNPVAGGAVTHAVSALTPGETVRQFFDWNTAVHSPGRYQVLQTVDSASSPLLENSAAFEILPSMDFHEGLRGNLEVAPGAIESGGTVDLTWTVTNTGNVDIDAAAISIALYEDAPSTDFASALAENSFPVPAGITMEQTLNGEWRRAGAPGLAWGEYLAVLKGVVNPGTRTSTPQTLALRSIRVGDTTPPLTSCHYRHPDTWTQGEATLSFTSRDPNDGSGVEETWYRIDQAPREVGQQLTIADEGTTRVFYGSIDSAGNVEPEKTVTVKLDGTPPVITHDFASDAGPQGAPVTVAFTASDALSGIDRSWCVVDGVERPGTGGTLTLNTPGDHIVVLNARDVAGNTTEERLTVRVADAPPEITHDFIRDGEWVCTAPTITYSAADPDGGAVTTWHRVDEGAPIPAETVTVRTPGKHSVLLGATDAAGSETTIPLRVWLDTRPPQTTHDFTSDGRWLADRAVTVTLSATDDRSGVARTHCTVGGTPVEGPAVRVTSEGATALAFHSEDVAGNVESEKTVTVKLDGTPPVITHDFASDAGPQGAPVTVAFTASDALSGIDRSWCVVDGVERPGTGGTLTLNTPGDHIVVLNARDVAGNTTEERLTVRVADAPPEITHDFIRDGEWVCTAPTITYSAADPDGGAVTTWHRVDEGAPIPAETVTVRTPGKHSVLLGATDAAGSETTIPLRVWLDTRPPQTTHDFTSDGRWLADRAVTVTLSATDDRSGVARTHCTVGGTPVEGPAVRVTSEGATALAFHSEDVAGNVESEKTVTVKLDGTPPVITHDIPVGTSPLDGPAVISFDATDPLSGVAETSWTLDKTKTGSGKRIRIDTEGRHTVLLSATDRAGNKVAETLDLRVRIPARTLGVVSVPRTQTPVRRNAEMRNENTVQPSRSIAPFPATSSRRVAARTPTPPRKASRQAPAVPEHRQTETTPTVVRHGNDEQLRKSRLTHGNSPVHSSPRRPLRIKTPNTHSQSRRESATYNASTGPDSPLQMHPPAPPARASQETTAECARCRKPGLVPVESKPAPRCVWTWPLKKVAIAGALPSVALLLLFAMALRRSRTSFITFSTRDGENVTLQNPGAEELLAALCRYGREEKRIVRVLVRAPLSSDAILLRHTPCEKHTLACNGSGIVLSRAVHTPEHTGDDKDRDVGSTLNQVLLPQAEIILDIAQAGRGAECLAARWSRVLRQQVVWGCTFGRLRRFAVLRTSRRHFRAFRDGRAGDSVGPGPLPRREILHRRGGA